MPTTNADVAGLFRALADLLEIEGANPFRVRAYRRAADTIERHSRSVAGMLADGEDLTHIEGVGKDLAGKVQEIVETGTLAMLKEEQKRMPSGVADLLDVAGVGPKRAKLLHDELGIRSRAELKAAAEAGKLHDLKGLGAKVEAMILKDLDRDGGDQRSRLDDVTPIADKILAALEDVEGTRSVEVAGSVRRRRDTIGDLDFVAVAAQAAALMDRFTTLPGVVDVLSKGTTRSTVRLENGLQVDLRVVPAESAGAALHYFTGSKAHNIAVRRRGLDRGLKVNEYGVFKDDRRIAGRTEDEVFQAVDLPFIPPELREDRGEFEAAENGRLPRLVEQRDIRGDLHSHTTATDGRSTLKQMAHAAEALGHEYLAITDHTQRTHIANGMEAAGFLRQYKAIDKLNEEMDTITLLKSAEVDILKDGSLDLPDEVLKEADLVVCSLHYPGNLDRNAQTDRVIKAMSNRYATILGHPTGRILGARQGTELDLERLFQAAADDGWMCEMNAQPKRLDVDDQAGRMAKQRSVGIAISTDAHSTEELGFMRYGVDQARRAWLETKDVLNTATLKQLQKRIAR